MSGAEFHAWVRQSRRHLELTQTEMAKEIGVSRATIVSWEKGVASPQSALFGRVQKWAKERGLVPPLDKQSEEGLRDLAKIAVERSLELGKLGIVQQGTGGGKNRAFNGPPTLEALLGGYRVNPIFWLADKALGQIVRKLDSHEVQVWLQECERLAESIIAAREPSPESQEPGDPAAPD